MKFSSFTFILTGDCNFHCPYCYQREKGETDLDPGQLFKAFDFFSPHLEPGCYINFSGGEPLLAFDLIREAVRFIQERDCTLGKNIRFCMTTNGSLINGEILDFLNQSGFHLLVSFDGLAQEVFREKGSFKHLVSVLQGILSRPSLELETNSVFTPETIGFLSSSLQFIAGLGISDIRFSLSNLSSWEGNSLLTFEQELISLRKFLQESYRKKGIIPVSAFRTASRIGFFSCSAGKEKMALSPGGEVWGCFLFPDFFRGKRETAEYKKYCFGGLDAFIKDWRAIYPKIIRNYSRLGMENFSSEKSRCRSCLEVVECRVCPIDAAFSSSHLGKIPSWICESRKIFRNQKRLLGEEIGLGG